MRQTAVIVDYGSGNLHSAGKALERAALESGADARIVVTADPDEVQRADRIVLPGVGAFADCRAGLAAVDGLEEALHVSVRERGQPFLGICVGLQLMATHGLEFGRHAGLNWIEGEVRPITPQDPACKVPHMGWNTVLAPQPAVGPAGAPRAASAQTSGEAAERTDDPSSDRPQHPLFSGISLGAGGHHAYFVHSYHFVPTNPDTVIATTHHGGSLTAAAGRDNLFGTQFHPEKSQGLGLKLLANFLSWSP
ncbi:MAG: imidazole glycerol phosphate synthase subunit HisH [Pseudomonadota bacterium]